MCRSTLARNCPQLISVHEHDLRAGDRRCMQERRSGALCDSQLERNQQEKKKWEKSLHVITSRRGCEKKRKFITPLRERYRFIEESPATLQGVLTALEQRRLDRRIQQCRRFPN